MPSKKERKKKAHAERDLIYQLTFELRRLCFKYGTHDDGSIKDYTEFCDARKAIVQAQKYLQA